MAVQQEEIVTEEEVDPTWADVCRTAVDAANGDLGRATDAVVGLLLVDADLLAGQLPQMVRDSIRSVLSNDRRRREPAPKKGPRVGSARRKSMGSVARTVLDGRYDVGGGTYLTLGEMGRKEVDYVRRQRRALGQQNLAWADGFDAIYEALGRQQKVKALGVEFVERVLPRSES